MKKIVDICNGDFVVLGNEKAKVIKSGLVGYKDTIIIELNDGSNLEVTGNHPVFTTRGIVYADELVYDDVVIQENDLWKMKSLMGKGLREEFINYIEELNTGYGKGGAFIAHKKMGLKHFFIEIFGKIDMGSYQGVTKLCQLVFGKILEMKTGKLGVDAGVELSQVNIPFKSFRVLNIIENRLVTFIINIMAKDCIGRFGSITILKFLQNIIYIIAMGIRQIIRLIIYSLYLILIIPNFLLRLINGLVQMKIKNNLQNRVGDLLQLGGARVVKIRAGRLKIPVYDLTVEKHHCYLANGILVSNSDAFRIFAVGYRRAKPAVVQNNNPGGVSYLIPGVG